MPRPKGTKNKKPTVKKPVKKLTQKQSQTVHVHLAAAAKKPTTRRKRTSQPKEGAPQIGMPKSTNNNHITSSASSGLNHSRGLINNEQPTIIQQIMNPDVEKMLKRLDFIDNKINSAPAPSINISTPQPNIKITTNKTKQPPPGAALTSENVAKHKSVVRIAKSATRKGTLFKPSDLDETASVASFASAPSSISASASLLTPDATAPELGQKGPAVSGAERSAKHSALKAGEEKKLENRLYSLKGTGSKKGAIANAEEKLKQLQSQTPASNKQKTSLQKRIEKAKKEIPDLKAELVQVEADLKLLKSTKPGEKKGRPSALTMVTGAISSLLSPSKP
jgi:hypothetical protein